MGITVRANWKRLTGALEVCFHVFHVCTSQVNLGQNVNDYISLLRGIIVVVLRSL